MQHLGALRQIIRRETPVVSIVEAQWAANEGKESAAPLQVIEPEAPPTKEK